MLKESHAPVVKESPVPAEAVKAEAPAVAEPAQAPAVAEEKPARTRKSKAAAKPAEAPAEEAPKAEEKPAEAPPPRRKPNRPPSLPSSSPVPTAACCARSRPVPSRRQSLQAHAGHGGGDHPGDPATSRPCSVVLDDPEQMANFTYEPGRWASSRCSAAGESTFVINTPPSQKEYLQFSVMQAGEVTSAIHRLSPGDKVGVRCPPGQLLPLQ